jgi:hypothetical protein
MIIEISSDDPGKWLEVLKNTYLYDFYHTLDYHVISTILHKENPVLLCYKENGNLIALPLVIRPLSMIPGLNISGFKDATSVYGYAGPLSSGQNITKQVINNFHNELKEYISENKIISVFSRLHPLINQNYLLDGIGDIILSGKTIAINLRDDKEKQKSNYRRDHRYGINKLKRTGAVCLHDLNKEYLDDFFCIYKDNMNRVNANSFYYFDTEYFKMMLNNDGFETHLFVIKFENKIICGGIFTLCNGIVQYHLSGTDSNYLKLAPMKLLIDSVREWANDKGAIIFHLGGGLGGAQDELFKFKAGFSEFENKFYLWKWITQPEVYKEVCDCKINYDKKNNIISSENNYFPLYRKL